MSNSNQIMIKRTLPLWVHWYGDLDEEDYMLKNCDLEDYVNTPEYEKAEQDYINEQDNLATQN